MKKQNVPEISVKSTKEQILSAYNEMLAKVTEKQIENPQEKKKKEEEETLVSQSASHTSDSLLSDLGSLKSKTIKQIDSLSENLLNEFQKLSNVRTAVELEQKHLERLYQITETAHTLSVLLQTQAEQKEQFRLEMEQKKQSFEQEMASQKAYWKQQSEQLERGYKEQKENLEKSRVREEEAYRYALALKHRKELDDYNQKKAVLEKELVELKDNLSKREAEICEREKTHEFLKAQVEQMPSMIKEAVQAAEAKVRSEMVQKYDFESQLRQKEYGGAVQLNEQRKHYLESKIKEQESLIKELTQKADAAMQQVQSIACRALDTSVQRILPMNASSETK